VMTASLPEVPKNVLAFAPLLHLLLPTNNTHIASQLQPLTFASYAESACACIVLWMFRKTILIAGRRYASAMSQSTSPMEDALRTKGCSRPRILLGRADIIYGY
jgi:hypothetical protein